MLLVVGALVALVYVLAKNAPGPTTTSPPTDNSIALAGTSGVPSPADFGGNPLVNSSNQTRLDTTFTNVDSSWKSVSSQTSEQSLDNLKRASDSDTNYLTNTDTGHGIPSSQPDGVSTIMPHHAAGFWSDPTKA